MSDHPLLDIDVLGDPVPQGSKRAFIAGGRAVVVDDNSKGLRSWRNDVSSAARQAWGDRAPLDEPVSVALRFWMRRPQRPKHSFPAVAPDIDKVARGVLDALTTARVFRDDCLVVQLNITQLYEADGLPPGVHIRLWTLR